MRRTRERWFRRSRCVALGLVLACAALVNVAPAAGAPANNFPYPDPETLTGDTKARDPMMLISAGAPRYFLFSTGPGIPFRTSSDRRDWTSRVSAFPLGTDPPWWVNYLHPTSGNRDIWAPDVSYRNGRYWMYYAVSWCQFSNCSGRAAIGLATSLTGLPGTWQDQGIVINSQMGVSPYKAIDPNLVVTPAGQWSLVFGSGGIWSLALDPATGMRPASAPAPVRLTDTHEGGFVYRRGGYYYLFHSWGTNTPGPDTTYDMRVGRSTSPAGPYVDRAGVGLVNHGGTLVLEGHGWMQAAGHGGVFLETNDNKERMYYHYYDSRDNYQTYLGINVLNWTGDDWPYLIHNYGPTLPATYKLFGGDFLQSQNGAYTLTTQLDCNLVERRTDTGAAVWSSGTSGLGSNCRLVMQSDGNLVLYNGAGTAVWSTGTNGTGSNNHLSMQNDGNIVVYTSGGTPVWSRF
jgi:arabinan endo-1,5-alpha-L-arabinosidase